MVTPTLLVLAAGMGSRYGGLKQMDPVGPDGETIMDYSIFDARRAGFGKVVFVIRREIEEPFKKIAARYGKGVPVEYVFQEVDKLIPGFSLPEGRTKPWGTTHAILMGADVIHEPFAVINADDFYGAESFRVLAQQLQTGSPDDAMVGFVLRNTLSEFGAVARGVCDVSADGYLKDIEELTSIKREGSRITNVDSKGKTTVLSGDELVSMNMWGFTERIFAQLGEQFQNFLMRLGGDLKAECYIPSTVNTLIQTGQARVKVMRSGDAWFGVTYREDHPRVVQSISRLIEGGAYPRRLWR